MKRLAVEWERLLEITILDPDGWRTPDAPSWDEPIDRDTFERLAMISTVAIPQRLFCV